MIKGILQFGVRWTFNLGVTGFLVMTAHTQYSKYMATGTAPILDDYWSYIGLLVGIAFIYHLLMWIFDSYLRIFVFITICGWFIGMLLVPDGGNENYIYHLLSYTGWDEETIRNMSDPIEVIPGMIFIFVLIMMAWAKSDEVQSSSDASRDVERAQANLARAQQDGNQSSEADRRRLQEALAKAQRQQEQAEQDARRRADRETSSRAARNVSMPSGFKHCGTCDRWCGTRTTDIHGQAHFNLDDTGFCTRFNSTREGGSSCGDYRKWSNLK